MNVRRESVVVGGKDFPRHVRGIHGWIDGPMARLVDPGELRRMAIASSIIIPPQFFVATADHETGFCQNEVDTEPGGFVSKGLFQVSDDEAAEVGHAGADLLDWVISTRVFARLQEGRLRRILEHVQERLPDVWAYLGLAHNEGLGTWDAGGRGALGTLFRFGMDWERYKARNFGAAQVRLSRASSAEERSSATHEVERVRRISAYGDDMINGGDHWSSA